MKHDEETIKAAKDYSNKLPSPYIAKSAFLSGALHKQKEVDELVELLEYAKSALKAVSSMGATTAIIERIDNGIKKHQP